MQVWGRTMLAVTSVLAMSLCPVVYGQDITSENVIETETSHYGTITKSVDGDTIHFRKAEAGEHEKDWKVRLVGIDAPELHLQVDGYYFGQAPWAGYSASYFSKMAPVGTVIKLVTFGKDKYGRYLGRIEKQNSDLNLKMVRYGWAIPYIICEGSNCNETFFERQKVSAYVSACEKAREEGKGVFDPNKPLDEMPFEFRLRMQKRSPDKYVGDFKTQKLYAPEDYNEVDVCQRIFFMNKKSAQSVGYN